MAEKLQHPRGTADVLPEEAARREALVQLAGSLLERAGYERIETPIFEATELFKRGVGGSTDIVRKEMYTFTDAGDRSITLRPEGTASVARSYVQHGMHKLPQPVKLWYYGPFFRYERAQAGRQRQFAQIGAEVLGSDSPLVDAELITILHTLLTQVGAKQVVLKLGSLGSLEARAEYRQMLVDFLRSRQSELSEDVVSRIDENPLRAFDAKDPGTQAVMTDAPLLMDHLSADDAEHFAEVRALLDAAGVPYELDKTLVRGLDYYTRTVFEFSSAALGAQSGVGGGGRYDGSSSRWWPRDPRRGVGRWRGAPPAGRQRLWRGAVAGERGARGRRRRRSPRRLRARPAPGGAHHPHRPRRPLPQRAAQGGRQAGAAGDGDGRR